MVVGWYNEQRHYCCDHQGSCHYGDVKDAMTDVLEARRAFDAVRAEAKAMTDRARAQLGRTMIRAREQGGESQATIAKAMDVGPQQVRAYEAAYREWIEKHPGESLDD